jgi:ribosomal-protein-alanine N-acetyltransferase
MEAVAHTDNAASNRILQKNWNAITKQYLENDISWYWYQLENNL